MKYIYLYCIILSILLLIIYLINNNNNNIKEKYENKKIVIHKIQLQPQILDAFPPGFGDILKGTFSLYAICKKYGYKFYLDLSEHPIGKYINQTIPKEYMNLPKEVNEYFISFNINNHNELINKVNEIMNKEDIAFFETNCEPEINKELQIEDIKELQTLFLPNDYLKDKLNNIKSELNLDKYSVLHIRTGDNNINKSLDSKIIQHVEDSLEKISLPNNILLLSDSKELKEYLHEKKRYQRRDSDIIHLGYLDSNNKEEGIESTLIDFFLICGAEKIYSLSVYDWNSGFSSMASKLYDIPIEKYKI